MKNMEKVKNIINLNITDDLLCSVVFEIGRYFDKDLIKEYKRIQKEKSIILSTPDRNILRKKYYYGDFFNKKCIYNIKNISYTDEDKEQVFADCLERLEKYDKNKIISSMKQRIAELTSENCDDEKDKADKWLKYYNDKRKNKQCSLLIFTLDQKKFKQSGYNENIITNFILDSYDILENYRYFAIVINGEIFNKKKECITWNLIYKASIFAENFIQYNDTFSAFKKEKQINILKNFLKSRDCKNYENFSENFYTSISTGYKYEDCYVSDNQNCKIIIYKKIELDETPVPCPSCNTTIQRGNSYPEIFLRSYECANPNCPSRSKSGRGKRFDEYSSYRYFKLVENNTENVIDERTYQDWRRDVFNSKLIWKDLLIKKYSYADENVFITDEKPHIFSKRNIINIPLKKSASIDRIDCFENLPIVKLFKAVNDNIKVPTGNITLRNPVEIINGDSFKELQKLKSGQIGTAITSPPYYNAREYSQWPNMILYYIDMFLNCKAVYNSLADGGYYLYNIGDIVAEDNVYVVSNMSKHRVPLGFLSCLIFEIAGYNLTGNIIWDKGEVQSKRNSTVNRFSGYVKCINCYEHIFVFRKGNFEFLSNSVEKITPVIKINSKGENTYKHTAPYPEKLVALATPYIKKNLYVLDPFLGSGTTIKWVKNNNFLGIGIEMNKEYYQLCLDRINDDNNGVKEDVH